MPAAFALSLLLSLPALSQDAASVGVSDTGPQLNAATWECASGHQIEKRRITLDSGAMCYTFLASGCVDASHGDTRPCAEGNFGMPDPTPANWYWGGFLQVLVNGTNATAYRIADMRVLETGSRGSFQIVWAHPDAEVGLRLAMLPGGDHVLGHLIWKPTAGVELKTLTVRLTCYPSFFTAARHRTGERHVATPRTDEREPNTLQLVAAEDTYLLYYDGIFDVEKGEGDGPCAVLMAPGSVLGGKVQIGSYAVITDLNLDPQVGQARLAFYDFTGRTNAAAREHMRARAAADLQQLQEFDFRPEPVRALDADRLRAQATDLLAQAADDGDALRPQVEALLAKVDELSQKVGAGDWRAEGDLASALLASSDLFWKLKTFAALNALEAR